MRRERSSAGLRCDVLTDGRLLGSPNIEGGRQRKGGCSGCQGGIKVLRRGATVPPREGLDTRVATGGLLGACNGPGEMETIEVAVRN